MKPLKVLGAKKKDGTKPVYFFLYIDSDRVKINTGVSVLPDLWDPKTGSITGRSQEVNDNNLLIRNCGAKINDIMVKFRLSGKPITAKQFKAEYINPSYGTDFLAWMEGEIKVKKNEVSPARMKIYNVLLNKLKLFRKTIYFSEIDHYWLEQFKGWLWTVKLNDVNTIQGNLRCLKSFTTRALRKKLIEQDPFLEFKIARGAVDRTFLTQSELSSLWILYTSGADCGGTSHRLVLRHFLFMCMTGMRISDFTAITFASVDNDVLSFYPIKTRRAKKQLVKVPLNQYSQRLIKDENRTEGLIFQPISEQKMNLYLKTIAGKVKIKKSVTNHTGRHTFATLFLEQTNDVAVLQRLLGHSKIEDTMKYVHITETNIIRQMASFSEGITLDHSDPV